MFFLRILTSNDKTVKKNMLKTNTNILYSIKCSLQR